MSGDVVNGNVFVEYLFTDKVVVDFDVLGSSMIYGVRGQGNGAHIITPNLGRSKESDLKFSEKHP
jgi:hypothetical protein